MVAAFRTDDQQVALMCAECGAELRVGTDALVLRRQIIGPGITETIAETWFCDRACVVAHIGDSEP